ncbi:hypothetical protein ABVK25_005380 [Lepraria finkii]|uniref:DUF7587 domain-containing protein n=1 Tax=Lepraria finkii TaxID=1340010 RepID=A0ABR4B8R3_9LECA
MHTESKPAMTPHIFFRVHDKSSATYFDEDGFVAGDHQSWFRMLPPRNASEDQKLFNALGGHLDWSNRTASPFISAYADLETAVNSAIARANQGKRGVLSLLSTLKVVKTCGTGMCQKPQKKLDSGLSHRL